MTNVSQDRPPAGDSDHTAIVDHFRSVDSAPADYAVDRPASGTNGFLVTLVGLSILVMCLRTFLIHSELVYIPRDLVLFSEGRGNVEFPLRMFIALFFLTYALFAYSNGWRRLFIAVSLLGKFAIFCLVVDILSGLLQHAGIVSISMFAGQMISGLAALAIFPHTLLRQAQLPQQGPLPGTAARIPLSSFFKLACCLIIAMVGAALAIHVFYPVVDVLKSWAILGGIGAGVFLMQQILASTTAVLGFRTLRKSHELHFAPPAAILVPAHNEAHSIGATIASVDEGAATYPGRIHLYVVNNASSDTTREIAEEALRDCSHITGEVLDCPTPGKAIALNMGIDRIREEFIVRIDADTVIGPGCLEHAMRHFAEPDVGCVGGIPMPAEEKTWMDKCRLIEVYMRHGFFQVSLDGYDGVMGIPGMFAVYRRSQLLEVGGMVQGMNGEDTDICMRLTAAGYRSVADPNAVYYSETPASYAHLLEQRTRWFRSIYHLTARNRAMLFDRQTMVGTFVLPFNLVNAARRAMLAPLILYAVVAGVAFQSTFTSMRWQPVVATLLGMSMIMTVVVCLIWRPGSVKYVPMYLVFRVLRSYFTLGSTLSLIYPPMHPRMPRRVRLRRGASAALP
ncbi:cellulose synthase/poly-beta-1,6-N-acetylglucosamine synthase-like glycosyltransferase [Rhodococcus sp. SMB37]|uniref:glycosyltransferase family 2 protein n=1 Tax=Rhodococcus sp. SMB37 TaxID=2512213 RepID=UPI001053AB48|nr:glycosyltransferase family 2 protein [Rhodococcus sp. SMB37]TCN43867.1 cellulose synthase/poly-beta-1,6-N-acetylglucosamine synthase-like glycosyltransferase [Rhodococcus sp. SMB37]